MFTYTTHLQQLKSNVWGYAVDIPLDIALQLKEDNISRVVCSINSAIEFQTGLTPNGNSELFITLNKDIVKQLHLSVGEQVTINLKQDESKYGLPVCEEFHEFLTQDEEFNHLFHQLTPGKQRNLIYIASHPKTSPTRLRKSLAIVDYLKSTNGHLDFKELNETIKMKK